MNSLGRPALAYGIWIFFAYGLTASASHVGCADYAQGIRWTASLGGNSSSPDVVIYGNYAYTDLWRITVIDLSDPAHPVIVGELAQLAIRGRMSADQELLAVVESSVLDLHSLADPSTPEWIARHTLPTEANDVCLVGSTCYVASDDVGIRVLDLSNPLQPVELSPIGSGDAYRVIASGNYLYALNDVYGPSRGLVTFDISNPLAPVQTSSKPLPFAWELNAHEGRLTVGLGTAGMAVADISGARAAQPFWLGTFNPGEFVKGVVAKGNHLITSNALCYAASGPLPWNLVGWSTTSFSPGAIEIRGNYVYITGPEALDVFLVSNPESDASVYGFFEPEWSSGNAMYDVVTGDGIAFVSDGSRLGAVDIQDPTAPFLLGWISRALIRDLALENQLLFASGYAGVDIYDVSVPGVFTYLSSVGTGLSCRGLDVVDDLLFVTAPADTGLMLVSVSDPLLPEVLGVFETSSQTVHVENNLALVQEGLDAIFVDVSDRSHPVALSMLESVRTATLDGSHAYFHAGGNRIVIYDLSNPTSPEERGSVLLPASPNDLVVADGVLYASTLVRGLQAIDVSDSDQPEYLGLCPMREGYAYGYGLAVDDQAVYIASATRLYVAPTQCSEVVTDVGPRFPAGGGVLEVSAHPNPFNPRVQISFMNLRAGAVDATVYDVVGRRVRTLLAKGNCDVGLQTLVWDGADEAGISAASGVYQLVIQSGEAQGTRKLVLLR